MPDVLVYSEGLISAPEQPARKEHGEEYHAVVPLEFGPSHVKLVAEPVDVQKWRGEFIEDKHWTVVIAKRPL